MYNRDAKNGNEYFKKRLEIVADRLGITLDEVVDRYIRRGLYEDDYFVRPKYSYEEYKKSIANKPPRKKHKKRDFFKDFLDF